MQGVLLSASADNYVTYWDTTTGKSLATIKDKDNSDIHSLDLSKTGTQFAMGGKAFSIKVHDYNTCALITTLTPGNSITMGHMNRVYSLKYSGDPNILLSGGWDGTIFIWDLRLRKSVGYIFGPHIYGDAIDVRKDTLVTGSYERDNALQLWSISQKNVIQNITWNSEPHDEASGYLYTARFEKAQRGRYIAASGKVAMEKYELHLYKNEKSHELIGKVTTNLPITSMDFMNTKKTFAFNSSNGNIWSFNYSNKPN